MRFRRFNLQTLMGVIVGWGVLLWWIRVNGSVAATLWYASESWIGWGLFFAASYALAWMFGPIVRASTGRAVFVFLLATFGAATLYAGWAQLRSRGLDYLLNPRAFPYPDWAMIELYKWFEARNPTRLHDLHGKIPHVQFTLGLLVLGSISMTGLLLCMCLTRPDRKTVGKTSSYPQIETYYFGDPTDDRSSSSITG